MGGGTGVNLGVLGLLVTAYFYRDKFNSFPSAILPGLVVILLANAVRATFLFHTYEKAEKESKVSVPA